MDLCSTSSFTTDGQKTRGLFRMNHFPSFADIQDGSSNTMAVSECMIGEPWVCRASCSNQPACVAGTDGVTLDKNEEAIRGYSWYFGYGYYSLSFSTLMPPNDRLTKNHECMAGSTRGVGAAQPSPRRRERLHGRWLHPVRVGDDCPQHLARGLDRPRRRNHLPGRLKRMLNDE